MRNENARKDLQVVLPDGTTRPLSTFMWPTAALMIAAFLLVISIFLPYWEMVLKAPQYPDGLRSVVYVDRLEGDTQEIDELNHYLGMPPLNEGGKIERQTSVIAIVCMALLLMAATLIHDQRAVLFALPALSYPIIFVADLQYILYKYGHSIDPTSALGGAIDPFTPPILGPGTVGQFGTESAFGPGFYLALTSTAMIVVAMWLHRNAWRPVVLAQKALRAGAVGAGATLLMVLMLALPSSASTVHLVGAHQPYASISAAVGAAADGDTVRVMPGVYAEHVVVDRSLTLEGVGAPVIDGGGRGTVVVLKRPGTVFRGFVVRDSGIEPDDDDSGVKILASRVTVADNRFEEVLFGIFAARAADVKILRNDVGGKQRFESARRGDGIRLWYCKDAVVSDNRVHGTRDLVAWYCDRIVMRGNVSESNRYGIHFMYSNEAVVRDNVLRGNSVGIYTMYSKGMVLERNDIVGSRGPSGYAVGLKDVDDITVRDNNLLDNRVGIFMDGAPLAIDSTCVIEGNLLAYNDIGVSMLPSVQRASFERNQWVENHEQVSVHGGGSAMGNRFEGNFWSDYVGFDADRDGTGDLAYRADELFENLADRSPSMRLFHMSLAQQAVDMAARLFPLVKPVPKLEDLRPRAQLDAPALASVVPTSAFDLRLAALLAVGLLLVALPRLFRRSHDASPQTKDEEPSMNKPRCSAPTALPGRPAHTSPRAAAIEIDGLLKMFGRSVAVRNIHLTVYQGEAVALWGSNGAGKTTIIRCVLGLLSWQRGSIRIDGLDARAEGCKARERIGYVPQELRFHDDLSVTETMQFYAGLRGLPGTGVPAALARVGLAAHCRKRVGELSGGMKQRLALALALLADPPILLLDEPTSNLDLQGRAEFIALLDSLKRQGKTLLFSAHHLEEVAPLADRVVLLENETMVSELTPSEFRRRLHHPEPAALIHDNDALLRALVG